MNLTRKIKIYDIVPVEFTEQEFKINKLFDDNLKNLVVFIDESNSNKINYMKPNGTFIMQQDNGSDRLWVRYKGFWEVLKTNFSMEYTDIQNLIQDMVERAFKHKVSSPGTSPVTYTNQIERDFKNKNSI